MATKLSWTRNAESDMDHYTVYLGGVKQGTVAQTAVGVKPEWPLPTTSAGDLTVTAVDKSGNESLMSVSVPFDSIAPAVPTGLALV